MYCQENEMLLQQDAVSCEVLTYYYANQIARDDFIPWSKEKIEKKER